MIDKLTPQDVILGGGAFVAGLIVADLFSTKPPHSGCGCGGQAAAIPATPQQSAPKLLTAGSNVAAGSSETLGYLEAGGSKGCSTTHYYWDPMTFVWMRCWECRNGTGGCSPAGGLPILDRSS